MKFAGFAFGVCLLVPVGCAIGLGPAVVDDTVVRQANMTGDAELISDVALLEGKRFRAGTGEFNVGMCMQQYVRGQAGEVALAQAKDDYARRVAQSEMLSGYMTCAQMCKQAVAMTPENHGEIAAKYEPRCVAKASASEEGANTEQLERLVAIYREATQPLGLFFADRDATGLIEHLKKQGMGNSTVLELAQEVEGLREANAESIEQGRVFFEGPDAQANFQARAANEGRQQALAAELRRLDAERDEAEAAGLVQRAGGLELEMASRTNQLAETIAAHEALKSAYEAMAEEAGVYTTP